MRYLLLFAFMAVTVIANAQNNVRLYAQHIKFITQGERWEDYEWKEMDNMVISFRFYDEDYNTGQLKIYSKKTQFYELIYTLEHPYDPKYEVTKWQAEDGNGYACTVRMLFSNNEEYLDMLVVAYEDMTWAYTVSTERK